MLCFKQNYTFYIRFHQAFSHFKNINKIENKCINLTEN